MENPSIQSLVEAERKNDKLVFISVLFRDESSRAVEYMKANGLNFPVLIADKNIADEYRVTGIPETFIIDKKGIVRQKIIGPVQWDSPDIKAAIEKLVKEG